MFRFSKKIGFDSIFDSASGFLSQMYNFRSIKNIFWHYILLRSKTLPILQRLSSKERKCFGTIAKRQNYNATFIFKRHLSYSYDDLIVVINLRIRKCAIYSSQQILASKKKFNAEKNLQFLLYKKNCQILQYQSKN